MPNTGMSRCVSAFPANEESPAQFTTESLSDRKNSTNNFDKVLDVQIKRPTLPSTCLRLQGTDVFQHKTTWTSTGIVSADLEIRKCIAPRKFLVDKIALLPVVFNIRINIMKLLWYSTLGQ